MDDDTQPLRVPDPVGEALFDLRCATAKLVAAAADEGSQEVADSLAILEAGVTAVNRTLGRPAEVGL